MKKILSLILMFMLIFSATTSFANNQNNEKVLYTADEITDLDLIQSRIDNGVSDLNNIKIDTTLSPNSIVNNMLSDNKMLTIDTTDYVCIESSDTTAQLLKVTERNNETTKEYVINTLIKFNVHNIKSNGFSGSGNASDSDGNTGVLHLKTYYVMNSGLNLGTVENGTLMRFTSVYANLTRDDSSIDFSNLYLNNSKMGALYTDINGNNSYNSRNDQNSKTILRPSVNHNYSINDRGTYVLLNDGIFSGRLSAEATVTVSRGTSQWDLNCLVSFDSIS